MYFLLCSSDISGSVHWKLCGKNRSFNYPVSWDFLAFLIFSMLIMAGMVFTQRILQALVSTLWMNYEWKMCFSFISINMYNGKRGFIQGKAAKYFFYLFYPGHLTILVILRQILFLS